MCNDISFPPVEHIDELVQVVGGHDFQAYAQVVSQSGQQLVFKTHRLPPVEEIAGFAVDRNGPKYARLLYVFQVPVYHRKCSVGVHCLHLLFG